MVAHNTTDLSVSVVGISIVKFAFAIRLYEWNHVTIRNVATGAGQVGGLLFEMQKERGAAEKGALEGGRSKARAGR